MARGWREDKHRVDYFEREIKMLLAEVFICAAPEQIDQEEATDLLVFEVRPYRVGCRVRKYEYYERYPNEFTIRAGRPSGSKTELAKIIDGWGDFIFYGFADASDTCLHTAVLIDLRVFRAELTRHYAKRSQGYEGRLRWIEKGNRDNSSSFLSFDITSFPPGLITARWESNDRRKQLPNLHPV